MYFTNIVATLLITASLVTADSEDQPYNFYKWVNDAASQNGAPALWLAGASYGVTALADIWRAINECTQRQHDGRWWSRAACVSAVEKAAKSAVWSVGTVAWARSMLLVLPVTEGVTWAMIFMTMIVILLTVYYNKFIGNRTTTR